MHPHDDMGPLPVAHPREQATEAARRELAALLDEWAGKHSLSSAERVMLLADAARDFGARLVRSERRSKG